MQTAEQINSQQTGKVTVAAVAFPPTVNITPKPKEKPADGWNGGILKGVRGSVLKQISESALDEEDKSLLVAKVGKVDARHDLIQVHFHQHPFNEGNNGGWTVMPL